MVLQLRSMIHNIYSVHSLFCATKGLDFWMMWYFRLPGEELQAKLPTGSKCVRVLMDMWDSSVNLVPQDFVMNQQMVVPLPLVYHVIAMDMQISVMLRLVSIICFCAVQLKLLSNCLYFFHLGTSVEHLHFIITKTTAANHRCCITSNLRFLLLSVEYIYEQHVQGLGTTVEGICLVEVIYIMAEVNECFGGFLWLHQY